MLNSATRDSGVSAFGGSIIFLKVTKKAQCVPVLKKKAIPCWKLPKKNKHFIRLCTSFTQLCKLALTKIEGELGSTGAHLSKKTR